MKGYQRIAAAVSGGQTTSEARRQAKIDEVVDAAVKEARQHWKGEEEARVNAAVREQVALTLYRLSERHDFELPADCEPIRAFLEEE